MLFDRAGRIVAKTYARHEQYYPQPGWVEHYPRELWETTISLIREGLTEAGITASAVAALGITNQRETTVVWDAETAEPLGNAIVWQDRRTTGRIEELEATGKTAMIRRKTGLEPDAYFSATKLEWLLDKYGREKARAGRVLGGTIDSWLIYKLTGAHVTDVTNASRTMLFNLNEVSWDDELLSEFGVPDAMLPEVRPSSDPELYGRTHPGLFDAEIPVAAALGDQQAALFGQTCFEPGTAKNTYGTGSFFLMNTGTDLVRSDHGLLTTIGFQRRGDPVQYALEGSIFVTGGAVDWLVEIDLLNDPEQAESIARPVDSTDGVYVVPAFTGLGAPYWDGRARGTIIGLTRGTSRAHIVRATLEAIAYQTRAVVEAMEQDSDIDVSTLKVDGGAVANDLLCQLQADLLSVKVIRPQVDETTALGAAYAAGLAVGYWDSLTELKAHWQEDRSFTPELAAETASSRFDRWEAAVERARDWAEEL